MAFLTKGLKISLTDLRGEEPHTRTFHYEGGIREFVTYLNGSKVPLYDKVMYFEGTKNNVYVEVALQHNDSYNESVFLLSITSIHRRAVRIWWALGMR